MERKNSDQSAGGMGIMVEGKGSSQGTCIKDPWTKTMEGWTECERRAQVGQGRVMGKIWG